jgi:TonB family protein
MQFVVGTDGTPDPRTFRVFRSSHDLFTKAVLEALPAMRFNPARTGGKAVKQIVQMPFQFNLLNGKGGVAPVGNTLTAQDPNRITRIAPRQVSGQPTRVTDNQTYYEYQVEQAATPKPDNIPPRYPDLLRAAKVEGSVLMQFVVRVDGSPDTSTVKVLKSSHDLFTKAVLAALPSMRFNPAEVGGKAVKQLVQMPFQFNLSH